MTIVESALPAAALRKRRSQDGAIHHDLPADRLPTNDPNARKLPAQRSRSLHVDKIDCPDELAEPALRSTHHPQKSSTTEARPSPRHKPAVGDTPFAKAP